MSDENIAGPVEIYTDGSCEYLTGIDPGGYAAVIVYDPDTIETVSGADMTATCQKMELRAAIAGLETCREGCDVILYSDSQYLVKGYNEWLAGWKRKGWRNSKGKYIEHKPFWEAIEAAVGRHNSVTFEWIRGHAGHEYNERADRLANEARPSMPCFLDDDNG